MEILVTFKCCIKPLITNNLPKIYERFFFLKIANPFSSNVPFPGGIEVEHWLKIVNGKKLKKKIDYFLKMFHYFFSKSNTEICPIVQTNFRRQVLVLFYY